MSLKLLRRALALSCGVAASALLPQGPAHAGSFTVANGQTVTTTQTLDTTGDVGTVEAGGTIVVSPGAHGIAVTANGVTVNNAGTVNGGFYGINAESSENTIASTGNVTGVVSGIRAGGDENTIANTGTMTGGEAGIVASGDGNTIKNAGTATGSRVSGVSAGGTGNTITNTGTATGGQYGIVASGGGNTIANAGTATGDRGITALGDGNTITNDGAATGDFDGIHAFGRENTITNTGTATGAQRYGIYAGNDGNAITNAGTATGGYSGIYTQGNATTIVNAGTATGNRDYGIYANSDENTITNTGTAKGGERGINTVGDGNTTTNAGTATGAIYGIYADGDENTITNTGTANGDAVSGIYAGGSENTIANSGTVKGGLGYGILANGDGNTITNTGTATRGLVGIGATGNGNTITNAGTASGAIGIQVQGNGNTITNTGTIIGASTAVRFLTGTDNTLTLLAGSNIQGNLTLGDASNRLTVGPGLNTAFAFTGGTVDIDGLPYLVSGGKLYVVDITGFAVQDEMTNDLTRAIADSVEGRLSDARRGPDETPVAALGYFQQPALGASPATGPAYWLSAIGGFRSQDGTSTTMDFDTAMGGILGGIDGMVDADTRAGVFAGLAFANLDTEGSAQELDSTSFYGGVYAGRSFGARFVDLSLTAGWSAFDSERRIANNQVSGGIEHAEADYGGFLISPSLKLGTDIAMGAGMLTPSVRARYAGLFLQSYDESGSDAALSVDSRNVGIFDARAELAYAFAPYNAESGTLTHAVRIGLDGTASRGGAVDAALLGATLNFDVANDDSVRGFVGYDGTYALANGASLRFGGEAGYDSENAFSARIAAGFDMTF